MKTPAAPAQVSACSRSATMRMTPARSGPAVATACWVSITAASRSASRVSTRLVCRQPVTSRTQAMIPSADGVIRTENQRLSGAKNALELHLGLLHQRAERLGLEPRARPGPE